MVSLLVQTLEERDPLRALLAERGIETRPLFNPVHTMPMYAAGQNSHAVAEDLSSRGMNLPSWPGLTSQQIGLITQTIADFFKHCCRDSIQRPGYVPTPLCQPLGAEHTTALAGFFERLRKSGDEAFFHPHPLTAEEAQKRAVYSGRDFYCVLTEGERILGYGMLRGWDEGYEIPSLGIAMDAAARGHGHGRKLMGYLHAEAGRRGAKRIRLKVSRENTKAVNLYHSLGYVFEDERAEERVGFLDLEASDAAPRKERVG